MVRHCIVQGCSGKERLFSFPHPSKDRRRFLNWLSATGNNSLLKLKCTDIAKKFICNLHFEKKYVLNMKLCNTAIPTVNIPTPIDLDLLNFDDETMVLCNKGENQISKLVTNVPMENSSCTLSDIQTLEIDENEVDYCTVLNETDGMISIQIRT